MSWLCLWGIWYYENIQWSVGSCSYTAFTRWQLSKVFWGSTGLQNQKPNLAHTVSTDTRIRLKVFRHSFMLCPLHNVQTSFSWFLISIYLQVTPSKNKLPINHGHPKWKQSMFFIPSGQWKPVHMWGTGPLGVLMCPVFNMMLFRNAKFCSMNRKKIPQSQTQVCWF